MQICLSSLCILEREYIYKDMLIFLQWFLDTNIIYIWCLFVLFVVLLNLHSGLVYKYNVQSFINSREVSRKLYGGLS